MPQFHTHTFSCDLGKASKSVTAKPGQAVLVHHCPKKNISFRDILLLEIPYMIFVFTIAVLRLISVRKKRFHVVNLYVLMNVLRL